ncbi:MAG: hypothetical protein WBY71_12695, partial [Nitrososphaeraceae archaeon]
KSANDNEKLNIPTLIFTSETHQQFFTLNSLMISKYSAFYSIDHQILKDMVLSKYSLSFLFMDVRRNGPR